MNLDQGTGIIFAAISHYGYDNQLDQTIEECLELALAIRKLKRAVESKQDDVLVNEKKFSVADEIADVIIMCEQSAHIVGIEAVKNRIDFKLERLKNRINNAEGSVIV